MRSIDKAGRRATSRLDYRETVIWVIDCKRETGNERLIRRSFSTVPANEKMAGQRRKRIPRAVPLFVWCLLLFVFSIASIIPVVDATKRQPSKKCTATTQSLKQRLQQRLQKLLENQLQRVLILLGKQKKSSGSWPSPRVIDEFLSIEEAAQLIKRYTPLLQQKSGFLNSKGQLNRISKYRSSSTVRVPPLGDPLILLCLISSLEYLVLIGGLW